MQIPVNEVKIEKNKPIYQEKVEQAAPETTEVVAEIDPEVERMLEEAEAARRREQSLKMSIIGIVLSLFAGIGIIFSVIGIVEGVMVRKRDTVVSRYAVALGIIGCVLSILFAVLIACVIFVLMY